MDIFPVADNIRAELARRRITHNQLGAHLGLTRTAISRRLCGQVDFSASDIARTAQFLGVDVATLWRDAGRNVRAS